MDLIEEGSAKIAVGSAFYNPKMAKLRDISVLFLRALEAKGKLLDATAATGIRAIRYAKEAGLEDAVILDINTEAAKSAKKNAKANGLKARVLNESVQEFAGSCEEAFDVIDVDPFGTPAPLVHDVLKVSKRDTLLMVTATDTATLCGAESDACLKIYASKPMHNELCHEAGTRILLSFVAREAAQFNFGIEPLLCISDMHYIRLFLRLKTGANEAVGSLKSSGFGAYCNNCHGFYYKRGIVPAVDTQCKYCGSELQAFGPLWLGNLHDKKLISKMLKESKGDSNGAQRLLEKIQDELDIPFLYSLPRITSYLKSTSARLDAVIDELKKKHNASRTHFEENAVKTDATVREVINAVKTVLKRNGIKVRSRSHP